MQGWDGFVPWQSNLESQFGFLNESGRPVLRSLELQQCKGECNAVINAFSCPFMQQTGKKFNTAAGYTTDRQAISCTVIIFAAAVTCLAFYLHSSYALHPTMWEGVIKHQGGEGEKDPRGIKSLNH